MLQILKSISLVCLLGLMGQNAFAQELKAQKLLAHPQDAVLVDSIGEANKYLAMIELPKAYLSGVCILKTMEDGKVVGCLFNEFGISALEFTYRPGDKKVKLINVIPMMNKWYVKRIIRRDLVKVYQGLLRGESIYRNEKYHITYKLTPVRACVKPQSW